MLLLISTRALKSKLAGHSARQRRSLQASSSQQQPCGASIVQAVPLMHTSAAAPLLTIDSKWLWLQGLDLLGDYDYVAIFDADFKPDAEFLVRFQPPTASLQCIINILLPCECTR